MWTCEIGPIAVTGQALADGNRQAVTSSQIDGPARKRLTFIIVVGNARCFHVGRP